MMLEAYHDKASNNPTPSSCVVCDNLTFKTTSPHSSPAFMVRNHVEIKRGKTRMVISYERLNEQLVSDGYLYIIYKYFDFLIRRIKKI